MNLKRVKALSRKEFIQIIRDPRSLALALAIPVLLLMLFGYALTVDVDSVPLVIWNQDNSQVSTDFILGFRNSKYFHVVAYHDNYALIQKDIDKARALMGIIIPKDFSKDLAANRIAHVQLLLDGSDSNTATIAMGYVNSVVSAYNVKLISQIIASHGIRSDLPIDLRPRIWFNPELKSRNFIIPGLIAVIMMIISALLTSMTVAREWERGTMEQLISTPVKPGELILGKFLPYFLIGFFDLSIAVAMGQFLFHIPFRGNLVLLFVLSGIFLTGALTMGMLISIVTKNQFLASQLAIITTFLPAFLLSGFMYAISNMPKVIQAITYIVPARYFIIILKGIYLKGVGINILAPQAAFLTVFALLMVNLAKRKFRKKVA